MNDYEKTIEVLQNRVRELEQQIQSVVGVKKWEPKGGNWFIYGDGGIYEGIALETERATQAQAQRASVEMCRFNRLLALRDELCGELCGDDVDDLEENKETYFVFYSKQSNMWKKDYILNIKFETPLFTSHDSAQKACDMLNSGEVEL